MADMDKLTQAMGDLDEDEMKGILDEVMADGGSQANDAMDACQKGMNIVGDHFEDGDYYVGDLIYAGELMTEAVDIMKEALVSGDGGADTGRLILATVKDDLHDIGKNIVKAMLEAAGFEVIDLGIDVAPETIVKTMQEEDIHIVALSGVLTLAIESMRKTVEAIDAAGLRGECKVIIGGACVTEDAMKVVGADEWSINPQKTVNACKEWAAAMA